MKRVEMVGRSTSRNELKQALKLPELLGDQIFAGCLRIGSFAHRHARPGG